MRDVSSRIVAVSAAFIGVAALAVSAYQAYISREQQRASVWPRIEILMSNSPTTFRLTLRNAGIGPALIETAEVRVDGRAQPTWTEVLTALGVPTEHSKGKLSDRVLSPETEQDVFSPSAEAAAAKLFREGGRVDVWVCYCSVYHECYSARRALEAGARMRHEEVDDCALAEGRAFRH